MPIISGIENVFVLKAPIVDRGSHFKYMEGDIYDSFSGVPVDIIRRTSGIF